MQETLPLNHLLQNRYIIESVIGRGGFGITYKAKHINLNKTVCIKELFVANINHRKDDNSLTQTVSEFSFASFLDRFVAEAQKIAVFDHPNIVKVLDLFQANNTAYIVMEYIEGETLKAKIKNKLVFSEEETDKLLYQLLDAVAEIHDHGMIHRDIKPENIMITPKNKLVLIDFGTSKELSTEETMALGSASTIILTPEFAAPEQYSPKEQKGTYTDVYAIGATLYNLLTGETPPSSHERYRGHKLDKLNQNSKYYDLIVKSMDLEASDRIQNVVDFREAFILKQNKPIPPVLPIDNNQINKDQHKNNKNIIIKETKDFFNVFIGMLLLLLIIIAILKSSGVL